ncbi:OmpA family protein [Hydrogenophaga sp.]|uniref:OmpA family protein n=1 Tax=Hydrogenophaga sp. TaxID=1904254 RepID=UPI003F701C5C
MKSTHILRVLTLAGLGSLIAATAYADEPGFFYGGISAGNARSDVDEAAVAAGVLGGAAVTGISSDERDNGYKLFGGYQLNRNIGFEAGYFDLGKTTFSATAPGGAFNNDTRMRGLNLDLVGTLPITDKFSLLGRVGVAMGRTRASFTGAGAAGVPDRNDNKANAKVGLGVQYEINRSFWVRGEVERYRVNNGVGGRTNTNLYSVGLVFPFGRAPLPAPYVAQAPAYVAPAPAPVVVQAPPPPPAPTPAPAPVPQRVSMSAESLFGFDAATVKPEGRAALDTFANSLSGTSYQTITVEGHTDRLGSDQYNQKLSEERAASVKNHLVTSGKLDGSKISAVGKGESMPVTKPGDCRGTQRTSALVACLQPDRRVDVEVTGTR